MAQEHSCEDLDHRVDLDTGAAWESGDRDCRSGVRTDLHSVEIDQQLRRGVDPRHEPLCRSLFVARRPADLSGEEEVVDDREALEEHEHCERAREDLLRSRRQAGGSASRQPRAELPRRDAEDRAISEAIIAMGRTLSLTVVAEGVETCQAALDLGRKYHVDLPIVQQMAQVLHEGKPPRQAIRELMERSLKSE